MILYSFLLAIAQGEGSVDSSWEECAERLAQQEIQFTDVMAHFTLRMRTIDLHEEDSDRLRIDISEDPKAISVLCVWAKSSGRIYWEWWPQAGAGERRVNWFDGEKWYSLSPESAAATMSSNIPADRHVFPDAYYDTFNDERLSELVKTCRIGFPMFEFERFSGCVPLRMRIEVERYPTSELILNCDPGRSFRPIRVYHVYDDVLYLNYELKSSIELMDGLILPNEYRLFKYGNEAKGHFVYARSVTEYHAYGFKWTRLDGAGDPGLRLRLPSGYLVYNEFAKKAEISGGDEVQAVLFWMSNLSRSREIRPPAWPDSGSSILADLTQGSGPEPKALPLEEVMSALTNSCGIIALGLMLQREKPGEMLDLDGMKAALQGAREGMDMAGLVHSLNNAGIAAEIIDTGSGALPDVGEHFIAYLEPRAGETIGHFVLLCPFETGSVRQWQLLDFPASPRYYSPGDEIPRWAGAAVILARDRNRWIGIDRLRSNSGFNWSLLVMRGLGVIALGLGIYLWMKRKPNAAAAIVACLLASSCGSGQVDPQAPAASLRLEPLVLDLGLLPQAEIARGSFRLHNDSENSYRIDGIVSSCTCTSTMKAGQTVPPAASIEIPIEVKTYAVTGGEISVWVKGTQVVEGALSGSTLLASGTVTYRVRTRVAPEPNLPRLELDAQGVLIPREMPVHVFVADQLGEASLECIDIDPASVLIHVEPPTRATTFPGESRYTFMIRFEATGSPSPGKGKALLVVNAGGEKTETAFEFRIDAQP